MISITNKREVKVHSMFFGIFLFVLTITVAVKVWNGTEIMAAIWQFITGIRPLEVAMFIAFWYEAVYGKRREEQKTHLTILNLDK